MDVVVRPVAVFGRECGRPFRGWVSSTSRTARAHAEGWSAGRVTSGRLQCLLFFPAHSAGSLVRTGTNERGGGRRRIASTGDEGAARCGVVQSSECRRCRGWEGKRRSWKAGSAWGLLLNHLRDDLLLLLLPCCSCVPRDAPAPCNCTQPMLTKSCNGVCRGDRGTSVHKCDFFARVSVATWTLPKPKIRA